MKIRYQNPGFEYSVDSILLFQTEGTTPYWSDALAYFYPQVDPEKMKTLGSEEKKAYLTDALSGVWDDLTDEFSSKAVQYREQFERYHSQIEDALSEAFELNTRPLFNDLIGNITLNPVCPRFLAERRFDVFYRNSARGALGTSIHEIIHFVWFYKWQLHFHDGYDAYDAPSLKWILSEMVVESIMNDERLSSINPYYPRENGGCVYGYFQDMIIDGTPVLDTLDRMYRKSPVTSFMEEAYRYCLTHEKAIRAHIEAAEKAF